MADNILFITNSKKLSELVPEAQWAALCWMNDCFSLGRPFTVSEVFRTADRQKALYAQGRTKPGPIVTERDGVTKVSDHQLRLAADIYPNFLPPENETPGIIATDTADIRNAKRKLHAYLLIADVAKQYGIEQPYTKGRFIDLPHFTFSNAKQRPVPRKPNSPQEAMRQLQRQYRSAKTQAGKARILARIEEIRSKQ